MKSENRIIVVIILFFAEILSAVDKTALFLKYALPSLRVAFDQYCISFFFPDFLQKILLVQDSLLSESLLAASCCLRCSNKMLITHRKHYLISCGFFARTVSI